jgi:hypothetical protein
VPKPRKGKAHLPAGTSPDDIEASVRAQVQFRLRWQHLTNEMCTVL